MGLFEKHVDIFKKRDKEHWLQIRNALKEAKLPGVRSGHYLQETVMGGGCGTPEMTKRSGYVEKAYELGKAL